MGSESFRSKAIEQKTKEVEEIDESKRTFMKGAAALGFSAFFLKDARGAESLTVEKIRQYEQWIQSNQEKLAITRSGNEIERIVTHNLPPLDERLLEGTEFDHRNFFKQSGSWVTTFIGVEQGSSLPALRWIGEDEKNEVFNGYAGNSFSIARSSTGKKIVISNEHILRYFPECSIGDEKYDIAGCPLEDTKLFSNEVSKRHFEKTTLTWNEGSSKENIDGTLVHIPITRIQNEGFSSQFITQVISGIPFKIKSDDIWSEGGSEDIFFSKQLIQILVSKCGENSINILKRSHAMIIAPREVTGDGVIDVNDVTTASGAAVYTNINCKNGIHVPSGILWGVMTKNFDVQTDDGTIQTRSFTVALIHGPEAIGQLLDTLDPVDSEAILLEKVRVTKKIQEALNVWRRKQNKDSIAVDGDYGEKTYKAVYYFQVSSFGKNGTYTPGVVDERTWSVLLPGEPYEDIQALHTPFQV